MSIGEEQGRENRMQGADTIYALASGRGRAGIAVVRLSGPAVRDSLCALGGRVPAPRRATRMTLRDPASAEPLDEALVLFFPGPRSFTGEDVAELHLHGGPAVVAGVLEALSRRPGLRGAEAGEFARRAFSNGKLDLTEVEGLADLIEAETRAQRLQALRQCGGALGALYDGWREALISALACVEAALDFSDEADVPERVAAEAGPLVRGVREEMQRHLDDARRGERLREGLCVVLAGPPNAGKSSLLNALAARDVAIVSEEPGTTRDILEVHLDLEGWPVTLLDTAGLREAAGAVESEGIRRALERARSADLVLWLIDPLEPVAEPPEALAAGPAPLWRIVSKADLPPARALAREQAVAAVSARSGTGLDALTARLSEFAGEADALSADPLLTRARHREEITRAAGALDHFLAGDPGELELRAEDLRCAAHALGRITGRVDVEDVLDRIFAEFCIGK